MDTVPQTVNCVDVLSRTSQHLHSHLQWTSLEPGHCHCAVCLMEPHMNIVGLREAAAVPSVAVGGCREVTCLLPVVDIVRVESAVI